MAREGNEFKLSEQEKWIPTISADNEQHVLLYKKLLVASQEILMCKDGNRSACVLYVLQNFQGKKIISEPNQHVSSVASTGITVQEMRHSKHQRSHLGCAYHNRSYLNISTRFPLEPVQCVHTLTLLSLFPYVAQQLCFSLRHENERKMLNHVRKEIM